MSTAEQRRSLFAHTSPPTSPTRSIFGTLPHKGQFYNENIRPVYPLGSSNTLTKIQQSPYFERLVGMCAYLNLLLSHLPVHPDQG